MLIRFFKLILRFLMIQRNIQIEDSQILLAILYFFHVKKTKILDK